MQPYQEEQIRKLVHLENETRKLLNQEGKRVKELLKPFEGKEILKVDYTLMKKVKDLIEFPEHKGTPFKDSDNISIRIWVKSSEYSLMLQSSICINGGSYEDKTYYCQYHDGYKYIAKIKDCKLAEFEKVSELPLLDVEKELKEYEKLQELREKVKEQESKLYFMVKNL